MRDLAVGHLRQDQVRGEDREEEPVREGLLLRDAPDAEPPADAMQKSWLWIYSGFIVQRIVSGGGVCLREFTRIRPEVRIAGKRLSVRVCSSEMLPTLSHL